MFDAITARAREPHWYIEGGVPDTVGGRFRMLATMTALVLVRLEDGGESADRMSIELTERFISVMETEHREMGLGDPKLGRTVRTLVGSLAGRIELWRSAARNASEWDEAALESVHRGDCAPSAAVHAAGELRKFWTGLGAMDVRKIVEGKL